MSPEKSIPGSTFWEVKSRSATCHATGKAFEAGERIFSRLLPRVDGVIREDYCREAWSDTLREGALFHWQTHFRPPAPRKEPPFREDNAEELLRELVGRNDSDWINTVYILALLLERKRIFQERGVQRDPAGCKVRIYEHRDSDETFFIVDPEPGLEHLAALQEEVAMQLGWLPEKTESEKGEAPREDGEENHEENEHGEDPHSASEAGKIPATER